MERQLVSWWLLARLKRTNEFYRTLVFGMTTMRDLSKRLSIEGTPTYKGLVFGKPRLVGNEADEPTQVDWKTSQL